MSIFCVSLALTQIYTKRRAKNIGENTSAGRGGGWGVLDKFQFYGEPARGPVLYALDYIFDRKVTPLVYPVFTNGTSLTYVI